ncbi:hypothetical protein IPV69_04300 [Humisphaera borealis]|uniref:Uncharacterized protein n=1 Tax=Humisphaera borealis TaxID=2807512 RepID=A0A7M2WYX0_9BACT|nr:hypothetical protein IPV69_04300 [Humisphaera borealis]
MASEGSEQGADFAGISKLGKRNGAQSGAVDSDPTRLVAVWSNLSDDARRLVMRLLEG